MQGLDPTDRTECLTQLLTLQLAIQFIGFATVPFAIMLQPNRPQYSVYAYTMPTDAGGRCKSGCQTRLQW